MAFFASQKRVVAIDRVVDYASPPDQPSDNSLDNRFLRDYGTQEVMSTRTDVQTLYSHHIHGENQVIGLTDTGIDIYNCYFYDPDHPVRYKNDQPDTLHRKIQLYLPYANDREDMADAHGTHVAGTLVGEAVNGSRYETQYNVSPLRSRDA